MAETKTIKATCLCGAAKHEVAIPTSALPLPAYICHCTSCRHQIGSLARTVAKLPQTYKPSQALLDQLVPFEFSKLISSYHCKTCGSQMFIHRWIDDNDHSKGTKWNIHTGSLEQADGVFEIVAHEFLADTLDGGFADFLISVNGKDVPRCPLDIDDKDENGNTLPLLPVYWTSPDRPTQKPSAEKRLHCHCKCNGVNFYIARPSERSKKAAGSWPDLLIPYHLGQPRTDKSCWWLRDNGTKFLAGACSCDSCRLDTGQEWVEWAFVPTVDISLDAEGKQPYDIEFGAMKGWGTLKGYNSSDGVFRYHCGTCGATVFFTCDERTDLIDIAVGLLDAPEGARAETWLDWTRERLSFREDAVPRAESLTLAVEDGLKKFNQLHKK